MAENLGLGGNGAMAAPVISPDGTIMFVQCDMGGLYRSSDDGMTWRLVDGREMDAGLIPWRTKVPPQICPVAFDPTETTTSKRVFAFGSQRRLRESNDGGLTWPAEPRIPVGPYEVVTALAFDPITQRLFYGTGEVPSDALPGLSSVRILRRAPDGTWSGPDNVTDTTGRPITDEVIGFFVDPYADRSSGAPYLFVATIKGIFSSANPSLWTRAYPPPRRIKSFSGGSGGGVRIMYATMESDHVDNPYDHGVLVSDSRQNNGAWGPLAASGLYNVSTNPATHPGIDTTYPTDYQHVAVSPRNPLTAYLSRAADVIPDRLHQNTSGVMKTIDGGTNWTLVYLYRLKNYHPYANVEAGWKEYTIGSASEVPPTGLAVWSSPQGSSQDKVMTSAQVIDVSDNGGESWRQRYTTFVPAPVEYHWSSIGLEVTSTWNYYIHPKIGGFHLLCYTDLGLAVSDDAGRSWSYIPLPDGTGGTCNDVYELAFDGYITWAATADQHDIPVDKEQVGVKLDENNKPLFGGTVAMNVVSGSGVGIHSFRVWTDSGLAAKIAATADLNATHIVPDKAPIVSVAVEPMSPTQRRIFAAAWGRGVFTALYDATLAKPGQALALDWVPLNQGLHSLGPLQPFPCRLFHHALSKRLFCSCISQKPPNTMDRQKGGLFILQGPEGWASITENFPTLTCNIKDYVVDPRDWRRIFVCTEHVSDTEPGGLFVTTDGGANWSEDKRFAAALRGTGLSDKISAFAPFFDPSDSSRRQALYVTTRYHGMWWTRGGNSPWEACEHLPFLACNRLTFEWNGCAAIVLALVGYRLRPTMYVTTYGAGAWKIPA